MILPLLALALQTAAPITQDEEVVVRAPSKPSAQTPATMVVEPVAMFVAACDGDGDGITLRYELEECVERSFKAVAGSAPSLRYLAFADWAERYLGDRNALPSPFDADGDGDNAVTLPELQTQFSKIFSRFNKDGREGISRAELVTFRTAPVDANGPARSGQPKKGKRPDGPPPGDRGKR